MKYFIGIIAATTATILLSALVFCMYKLFTDDIYWGFVALGLLLPTIMSLLITETAFKSAKEY